MSNKRARCDAIDFRIQLQEGSDRIELELKRSTPLTADQRRRVLNVRVLGDTIPDKFFMHCAALTEVEMGTELVRIGHRAYESCSPPQGGLSARHSHGGWPLHVRYVQGAGVGPPARADAVATSCAR
jgi:hypothetical protein